MSETANWSYTNVATVWPKSGVPAFGGGFAFGEPYTIACTWTATDSRPRKDSSGIEFVPMVDFFHEDKRVKYGDMIAKGDLTAMGVPPANRAREIKAHVDWDMSFFDGEEPDFRSTT